MVELTFRVPAQDELRTVSGEIVSRDPLILSEPEESRPDWRIDDINCVDLISAKSGTIIHDFGSGAVFGSGYCRKHDVLVEEIPRDQCPYCKEEQRVEALRTEMAQRRAPRSVDDPAPIESYRH